MITAQQARELSKPEIIDSKYILEEIEPLIMNQINNNSYVLQILYRVNSELFNNIENNYKEVEKELVKLGYRIELSKYALNRMYTIEWM